MLVGLYEEARKAYAATGKLFSMHMDMLYACDLACEHCYLDDKKQKQLPTAFWHDVISQMGELGVFSVLMSGGEIFLRKDLYSLIQHARDQAIFVQLKTHGGHIDDDDVSRLVECGVSSVALSYYASDPGIHDAITQRPGSHERTLRAIKALRDSGMIVTVSCSVMKRNFDQVEAVAEEMHRLDIPVSFDGLIRVDQSGGTGPLQTELEHDDLVALLHYETLRRGGASTPSPERTWGDRKNCVAGHTMLYVDPKGMASPCLAWPVPVGDLNTCSLEEIWVSSNPLATLRRQREGDRLICHSCELKADCSYCPGQAWLENSDVNQPSQTVCRATYAAAQARSLALGEPPPAKPPGLTTEKPWRFPILYQGGV
jgi:radical SAM protein with 4Fe4S-binding SPASM domain